MWFSFFITWEQRKLGDVFLYERPDKYIVASDKYSDFYSTPVLTANKGFVLGYTNEKRTYNTPCVIFDDFTLDSKYVDFPFMVKSSALKILTTKQGYYLPFAYELLHAANIEVLGHARHYISVVQPTMVLVPSYSEQLRVGKFIEAIDNLITLHQRKQKDLFFLILSKKLSLILANDWEQCKFEEYFEERNERSGEGELISVTINSGIKKFNELGRFDTKPEDLSKYKRVEVGDIAYNSMRMWQGASGYSPYSGILSPAYTVISPKTGVSSLFFAYLIKRPQMIHLFEINSQGLTSDTWNLKFPAFSQIEASAPTEIAEQKNIAEIFTVLDNLITLHQCKENLVQSKYELHSLFQMQNKLADDWEQRKLGELGKAQSGIGFPDKEQGGKKGIPFFKVSDMNNLGNELEMHIANNYVSLEQIKKNGWSPIEETSVIFAKVGAAIMLNRKRLVRFPFLLDNNTMAYKFNDAWEIDFGRTLFERIDLTSLVQVGALPSYNAGDVENMEVAIPQKAEQAKLGALFTSLDNLITLHQCKRAAFFDWKRWLYSKFEESKITLAWEQRKFESLAETRRGLTYNPSNISPHGIRVLRSSNINEDTFVLSDDDVFVCPDAVKIECVKPNDILITAANGSTRLVGKHAIIVGIRENEAVHGGFMLVASSSMPFFLNAAMSAPWYLKFINLFVAGGNGAIGNLNKNDLDNQLLFVPKNAEQEQIGEFFRNLDNLITLHQRGEKINNRRQT